MLQLILGFCGDDDDDEKNKKNDIEKSANQVGIEWCALS